MPEVCAVWAKFAGFIELAPQQSPKINAKTAQIWVKYSTRIRWVLTLPIAA
jgi:hypothetical protein